jgi:peptidoglycan/xylan/chitin deacetylase (PgdA/CDA1 family)
VLAGRQSGGPVIPFPPAVSTYVVEWLREIAKLSGQSDDERIRTRPWPGGKKAAATITHDVDTDWLFKHPGWLERICDLEEKYGFYGAWYCVPCYSRSRTAAKGIQRLLDRSCEVGVHGYNHDAKFPLLDGRAFEKRLNVVRDFASRWNAQGFRSEWLYRSPQFLQALAGVFRYDSSVPSEDSFLTQKTANGCSSCFPYRTYGDLLELPLSLPMDEARRASGWSAEEFWRKQSDRCRAILQLGGLIMLSLHPQPHQAANEETLQAMEPTLRELAEEPRLWIARPDAIAGWVMDGDRNQGDAACG